MTQAPTTRKPMSPAALEWFRQGWNTAALGKDFYKFYPDTAPPAHQRTWETGYLACQACERLGHFTSPIPAKTCVKKFVFSYPGFPSQATYDPTHAMILARQRPATLADLTAELDFASPEQTY